MDLVTIAPVVKVLLKNRKINKNELEKLSCLNELSFDKKGSSFSNIYKFLLLKGIIKEEGDVVTLNVSSTYKS